MKYWQNNVDALYILGDFFDYWLGDDDDNPFISTIKQSLAQFTQLKPIYFIGGNHDFAIGKKFARETKIAILNDCSTINLDNRSILISHGDVFCSLDVKYQRMKKILQNPILIYILTKTPLKFRKKIKDKLEKKSTDS
jgi:UDP-2,3-diacylglucosamine hydrolase